MKLMYCCLFCYCSLIFLIIYIRKCQQLSLGIFLIYSWGVNSQGGQLVFGTLGGVVGDAKCWAASYKTVCAPQGGIAFVAIKGAFKVYFKQQQYLRQAHRKILNFPEQEEAWGGQQGRPNEWTALTSQERWRGRRWKCYWAGSASLTASPSFSYSSPHRSWHFRASTTTTTTISVGGDGEDQWTQTGACLRCTLTLTHIFPENSCRGDVFSTIT